MKPTPSRPLFADAARYDTVAAYAATIHLAHSSHSAIDQRKHS